VLNSTLYRDQPWNRSRNPSAARVRLPPLLRPPLYRVQPHLSPRLRGTCCSH